MKLDIDCFLGYPDASRVYSWFRNNHGSLMFVVQLFHDAFAVYFPVCIFLIDFCATLLSVAESNLSHIRYHKMFINHGSHLYSVAQEELFFSPQIKF